MRRGVPAALLLGLAAAGFAGDSPAPDARGTCSAPSTLPGFSNWGPPGRIGDLPSGPFEKRWREKIAGVHESSWLSPYGELRFLAFRLTGESAARDFFERWKKRATREQVVLRLGPCVTVATLAPAPALGVADVTKNLEAAERFGPGEAFADLEVPAAAFPAGGTLNASPFEIDVTEFEKQEGGIPLAAVRRFLWQRGIFWEEVLFHVPGDRGDLPALLQASLRFRRQANGHVVDFVGPYFVAEVIGSAPAGVDALADRLAKAHPRWKRMGDPPDSTAGGSSAPPPGPQ